MNTTFYPVELAILADYMVLPRSEVARAVDLGAHWDEEGAPWIGLRSPLRDGRPTFALENAVARILLRSIQIRLPYTGIVVGEQVFISRRIDPPCSDQSVVLMPRFLFEINWATTGPGLDWPEAYYVTWVPGFDRYIVTSSLDSDEGPTDYQDVAIAVFRLGWSCQI